MLKKPSFAPTNATDGVKSLLNAGQIEKMSPSPERALRTFSNSHADVSPVPKSDSNRKSWTETSRKCDFHKPLQCLRACIWKAKWVPYLLYTSPEII